ncbi:Rv1733c family protein [Streptomyces sp. SAS_270]|uniref:Rv1733c family protein n=1 Tax=Streptomyces sp. SAS_270 TaxID=3412748 RepID=UPI00403C4504
MRTRVRGWRWRRNSLRRRSDVVEACTVTVIAMLLLVGAPLATVAAGWWAHDATEAKAAAQRAERHRMHAVVVEDAPPAVPTTPGGKEHMYWVKVRWTMPGEGPRTGSARVPAGTLRGESAGVWVDTRGRSVGPPLNGTAVWQHTVTTGALTGGCVAAVVLVTHFLVRRIAGRHRLAEWEREWARMGPEWGRRTA